MRYARNGKIRRPGYQIWRNGGFSVNQEPQTSAPPSYFPEPCQNEPILIGQQLEAQVGGFRRGSKKGVRTFEVLIGQQLEAQVGGLCGRTGWQIWLL